MAKRSFQTSLVAKFPIFFLNNEKLRFYIMIPACSQKYRRMHKFFYFSYYYFLVKSDEIILWMNTTELQKFGHLIWHTGSSDNQVCKIHLTPKEKEKSLWMVSPFWMKKIKLKELMDGFTTLDEKVKIKKTLFISFHILPIWGLKKRDPNISLVCHSIIMNWGREGRWAGWEKGPQYVRPQLCEIKP